MIGSETSSTGSLEPGRYLTFRLEREIYAVPILDVREIIELQEISPVPRSAPWVRGVVNLRGRVLPVVDPKIRFGLCGVETSELTVIIVLQGRDGRPFGVLVDEVLEVQRFDANQLSPSAEAPSADETFLAGFGKMRDQLIFVLDSGTLAVQ